MLVKSRIKGSMGKMKHMGKMKKLVRGGSITDGEGDKEGLIDVDNEVILHNRGIDNANQGSNFFGANRNTPSGRTLNDLDVAGAHAFRRANDFIDPTTKESSNFGEFQDRFLGDRPGFTKDFESNPQLVNEFGDSDGYYNSILNQTNDRIKRRSDATVEGGFQGRFTPEFIGANITGDEQSLGQSFGAFKNRLVEPKTAVPINRKGGKFKLKSQVNRNDININAANQF